MTSCLTKISLQRFIIILKTKRYIEFLNTFIVLNTQYHTFIRKVN